MQQASLETVHLERLVRLRWFAITAQLTAILAARFGLGLALPLVPMLAIVTALLALNIATMLWLRQPGRVVRQRGLALQLLGDLAALTGLLYLSGGHANPFVFMLLPLLAIGAAALSGWYSAAIALVAVSCYSLLLVSFVPLPSLQDWSGPVSAAGLQRAGVWFCFVLSASMIVYFVLRTRATLRAHEQAVVEARERSLRQAHLATLGAIAANTAHEMASPLATIRLLVDEMETDPANTPQEEAERRAELGRQVDRCHGALRQLLEASGTPQATQGRVDSLDAHMQSLVASWRQRHPGTEFDLRLNQPTGTPAVVLDRSIEQALTHLADNAARAGDAVRVEVGWGQGRLRIRLVDNGPGLPVALRDRLGREPVTGEPEVPGQGLGAYLAQAAVERFGGDLTFDALRSGGTMVTVDMPLPEVAAETPNEVSHEPISAVR